MLQLSNFFHESEETNVERNERGPEFLRNLFFTKKLEARNFTDGNREKKEFVFFCFSQCQSNWQREQLRPLNSLKNIVFNFVSSKGKKSLVLEKLEVNYWRISKKLHLWTFQTFKRLIHATKIIKCKLSRQKNLKFLIWTLKRDIKPVPLEKDEL